MRSSGPRRLGVDHRALAGGGRRRFVAVGVCPVIDTRAADRLLACLRLPGGWVAEQRFLLPSSNPAEICEWRSVQRPGQVTLAFIQVMPRRILLQAALAGSERRTPLSCRQPGFLFDKQPRRTPTPSPLVLGRSSCACAWYLRLPRSLDGPLAKSTDA